MSKGAAESAGDAEESYAHPVVQRTPDGVLQLRFTREGEGVFEVNAALLAETLRGMAELSGIAAEADLYGTVVAPELKVRPPREGSFEIDFVVFVQQHHDAIKAVTEVGVAVTGVGGAAGILGKFFGWATKAVRATVTKTEELSDGAMTRVTWSDGDMEDLPTPAVRKLMQQTGKAKTRTALKKITAPLGDDAKLLEARVGGAEQPAEEIEAQAPEVVLTDRDHAAFSQEPPAAPPITRTFETEGRLQALDFKRPDKWRVTTPEAPQGRTVEVLDKQFLAQIAGGEAISAEDTFRFAIRETVDPSKKRRNKTWAILSVTSSGQRSHDGNGREHRDAPGP